METNYSPVFLLANELFFVVAGQWTKSKSPRKPPPQSSGLMPIKEEPHDEESMVPMLIKEEQSAIKTKPMDTMVSWRTMSLICPNITTMTVSRLLRF
jgi:hypothetical protein